MAEQTTVIYADQLLTMIGDQDAAVSRPSAADPVALRERDDAIAGLVEKGALAVVGEKIAWVGPADDLPDLYSQADLTLQTSVALPGFVDCHTHTVFAGGRADEFVARNLGAKYEEILAAGGGIHNSVSAVRAASTRSLAEQLILRCHEATRLGVTTMEVKSGYGLCTDDELKQLKAISMAREHVLVELEATFLGAHVVPKSHRDRRDDYVDLVCEEMIPAVAEQGLARFCDVFCDIGVFSTAEAERILTTGAEHGLVPRVHADELGAAGAALMAARVGAASADHLEWIDDEAIAAMAESGTVAVMLPGVNLFLRLEREAPARALLEAGVDVAVATDFNPGSSMTQHLPVVLTLASTVLGMTPAEVLRGATAAGARALRLDDRGTLEVGKRADIALLSAEDYWNIPYHLGHNYTEGVVRGGELVYWVADDEHHDGKAD